MEKQNTQKEIAYMDKSYAQKRKILRRFHFTNKDALDLTNLIKYKILKRIKDNKFVDKKNIIEILLIDGYVSYEKIYDENDNVIALNQIDPLTFVMEMDEGKVFWHQNKGKENARLLFQSQVLYVGFPNESFSSFVEMIYTKMVDKNSKYTLKLIVDEMVECYNNNFLKI